MFIFRLVNKSYIATSSMKIPSLFKCRKSSPPHMYSKMRYSLSPVWKAYIMSIMKGCLTISSMFLSALVCAVSFWLRMIFAFFSTCWHICYSACSTQIYLPLQTHLFLPSSQRSRPYHYRWFYELGKPFHNHLCQSLWAIENHWYRLWPFPGQQLCFAPNNEKFELQNCKQHKQYILTMFI